MLEIKPFEEWSATAPAADDASKVKGYADYLRSSYFKADALDRNTEQEILAGAKEKARQLNVLGADVPEEEQDQRLDEFLKPQSNADADARFLLDHYQTDYGIDTPEFVEKATNLRRYLAAKQYNPTTADELKSVIDGYVSDRNAVKQARMAAVDRGDFPLIAVEEESGRQIYTGPSSSRDRIKGEIDTLVSGGAIDAADLPSVTDLIAPVNGGLSSAVELSRDAYFKSVVGDLSKKDAKLGSAIQNDANTIRSNIAAQQMTTGEKILKTTTGALMTPIQMLGDVIGGALSTAAGGSTTAEERSVMPALSQLMSNEALNSKFSQAEIERYYNNLTQLQAGAVYDPDKPETGIRTDSLGNPIISASLTYNKGEFAKALAAAPLNEEQKQRAEVLREAQSKSQAPTTLNLVLGEDSDAASVLATARAAGKSDSEFLEEWFADGKNYSGLNERLQQFGQSTFNAIAQLPVGAAALLGFKPAAEALVSMDKELSDRQQYSSMYGDEYGLGFQIANTLPQIGVDIITSIGGGAALTAGKAAAKNSVRSVLRTGISTAASELVDAAAGTALRQAATAGGEAGVTQALKQIGAGLAPKLSRVEEMIPVAATSFLRSASSTYGSIYAEMPDTMSHEEKHRNALGYAVASGISTAAITSGFSFLGAGGIEDLATGTIRRFGSAAADDAAVATGTARRLTVDKLNFKQAKALYEDVVTQGKAVGDAAFMKAVRAGVGNAYKNLLRSSLKGGLSEGVEEALDQAIQIKLEDAALDRNTPLADKLNQIFHAFVIGGALGAGGGVISEVTSPLTFSDRVQAMSARVDVMKNIANRLRKTDSTATAEIVQRRLDEAQRTLDERKAAEAAAQAARTARADTTATADPNERAMPDAEQRRLVDILDEEVEINGFKGVVEYDPDLNSRVVLKLDKPLATGESKIEIGSLNDLVPSGAQIAFPRLQILEEPTGNFPAGTPVIQRNKQLFALPSLDEYKADNTRVQPIYDEEGNLAEISIRSAVNVENPTIKLSDAKISWGKYKYQAKAIAKFYGFDLSEKQATEQPEEPETTPLVRDFEGQEVFVGNKKGIVVIEPDGSAFIQLSKPMAGTKVTRLDIGNANSVATGIKKTESLLTTATNIGPIPARTPYFENGGAKYALPFDDATKATFTVNRNGDGDVTSISFRATSLDNQAISYPHTVVKPELVRSIARQYGLDISKRPPTQVEIEFKKQLKAAVDEALGKTGAAKKKTEANQLPIGVRSKFKPFKLMTEREALEAEVSRLRRVINETNESELLLIKNSAVAKDGTLLDKKARVAKHKRELRLKYENAVRKISSVESSPKPVSASAKTITGKLKALDEAKEFIEQQESFASKDPIIQAKRQIESITNTIETAKSIEESAARKDVILVPPSEREVLNPTEEAEIERATGLLSEGALRVREVLNILPDSYAYVVKRDELLTLFNEATPQDMEDLILYYELVAETASRPLVAGSPDVQLEAVLKTANEQKSVVEMLKSYMGWKAEREAKAMVDNVIKLMFDEAATAARIGPEWTPSMLTQEDLAFISKRDKVDTNRIVRVTYSLKTGGSKVILAKIVGGAPQFAISETLKSDQIKSFDIKSLEFKQLSEIDQAVIEEVFGAGIINQMRLVGIEAAGITNPTEREQFLDFGMANLMESIREIIEPSIELRISRIRKIAERYGRELASNINELEKLSKLGPVNIEKIGLEKALETLVPEEGFTDAEREDINNRKAKIRARLNEIKNTGFFATEKNVKDAIRQLKKEATNVLRTHVEPLLQALNEDANISQKLRETYIEELTDAITSQLSDRIGAGLDKRVELPIFFKPTARGTKLTEIPDNQFRNNNEKELFELLVNNGQIVTDLEGVGANLTEFTTYRNNVLFRPFTQAQYGRFNNGDVYFDPKEYLKQKAELLRKRVYEKYPPRGHFKVFKKKDAKGVERKVVVYVIGKKQYKTLRSTLVRGKTVDVDGISHDGVYVPVDETNERGIFTNDPVVTKAQVRSGLRVVGVPKKFKGFNPSQVMASPTEIDGYYEPTDLNLKNPITVGSTLAPYTLLNREDTYRSTADTRRGIVLDELTSKLTTNRSASALNRLVGYANNKCNIIFKRVQYRNSTIQAPTLPEYQDMVVQDVSAAVTQEFTEVMLARRVFKFVANSLNWSQDRPQLKAYLEEAGVTEAELGEDLLNALKDQFKSDPIERLSATNVVKFITELFDDADVEYVASRISKAYPQLTPVGTGKMKRDEQMVFSFARYLMDRALDPTTALPSLPTANSIIERVVNKVYKREVSESESFNDELGGRPRNFEEFMTDAAATSADAEIFTSVFQTAPADPEGMAGEAASFDRNPQAYDVTGIEDAINSRMMKSLYDLIRQPSQEGVVLEALMSALKIVKPSLHTTILEAGYSAYPTRDILNKTMEAVAELDPIEDSDTFRRLESLKDSDINTKYVSGILFANARSKMFARIPNPEDPKSIRFNQDWKRAADLVDSLTEGRLKEVILQERSKQHALNIAYSKALEAQKEAIDNLNLLRKFADIGEEGDAEQLREQALTVAEDSYREAQRVVNSLETQLSVTKANADNSSTLDNIISAFERSSVTNEPKFVQQINEATDEAASVVGSILGLKAKTIDGIISALTKNFPKAAGELAQSFEEFRSKYVDGREQEIATDDPNYKLYDPRWRSLVKSYLSLDAAFQFSVLSRSRLSVSEDQMSQASSAVASIAFNKAPKYPSVSDETAAEFIANVKKSASKFVPPNLLSNPQVDSALARAVYASLLSRRNMTYSSKESIPVLELRLTAAKVTLKNTEDHLTSVKEASFEKLIAETQRKVQAAFSTVDLLAGQIVDAISRVGEAEFSAHVNIAKMYKQVISDSAETLLEDATSASEIAALVTNHPSVLLYKRQNEERYGPLGVDQNTILDNYLASSDKETKRKAYWNRVTQAAKSRAREPRPLNVLLEPLDGKFIGAGLFGPEYFTQPLDDRPKEIIEKDLERVAKATKFIEIRSASAESQQILGKDSALGYGQNLQVVEYGAAGPRPPMNADRLNEKETRKQVAESLVESEKEAEAALLMARAIRIADDENSKIVQPNVEFTALVENEARNKARAYVYQLYGKRGDTKLLYDPDYAAKVEAEIESNVERFKDLAEMQVTSELESIEIEKPKTELGRAIEANETLRQTIEANETLRQTIEANETLRQTIEANEAFYQEYEAGISDLESAIGRKIATRIREKYLTPKDFVDATPPKAATSTEPRTEEKDFADYGKTILEELTAKPEVSPTASGVTPEEDFGTYGKTILSKRRPSKLESLSRRRYFSASTLDPALREAATKQNYAAASTLGLESGNSDSMVNALTLIAKGPNARDARIAELLLTQKGLVRSINFVMGDIQSDYAGQYDVASNTVVLNMVEHNGNGLANVLVHELLHAATLRMALNPMTAQQRAAVERIKMLREFTAKYVRDNDLNSDVLDAGLESLVEFITYAQTTPEFESLLRSIIPPNQRSIFRRLIDAVLQLFGFDPKANEGVANAMDELFNFSKMALAHERSFNTNSGRLAAQENVRRDRDRVLNMDAAKLRKSTRELLANLTPSVEPTVRPTPTPDGDAFKDLNAANEFAMANINSLVPEGIAVVETDKLGAGSMGVNRAYPNTILINRNRIGDLVMNLTQKNALASLRTAVNHELAHIEADRVFSDDDYTAIAAQLGPDQLAAAANTYYSIVEPNLVKRAERIEADRASGDLSDLALGAEWVRMQIEKMAFGRMTEDHILFLLSNPNLLDRIVEAAQRFIGKLRELFTSNPTTGTAVRISMASRELRKLRNGGVLPKGDAPQAGSYGDTDALLTALDDDQTEENMDRTLYMVPVATVPQKQSRITKLWDKILDKVYMNFGAKLKELVDIRDGTFAEVQFDMEWFSRKFPKLRDEALAKGIDIEDIGVLLGTRKPIVSKDMGIAIMKEVGTFRSANSKRTDIVNVDNEAKALEVRRYREEAAKVSEQFRIRQEAMENTLRAQGFGDLVDTAVEFRQRISRFKVGIGFDETNDVYLTRTYRYFTSEAYRLAVRNGLVMTDENGNEIDFKVLRLQAARMVFEAKVLKASKTPMTDEQINNAVLTELDQYLDNLDERAAENSKYDGINALKKDLNILESKKDIDDKLAKLLGDVTDPFENAVRTAYSVARLSANNQFQRDFADRALALGLASTTAQDGMVELFSERFDPQYGPMAGLYVREDIADAVKELFGGRGSSRSTATQSIEGFGKALSYFSGLSITAKTSLSIGFYARNIVGGSLLLTANGIMPVNGSTVEAMRLSWNAHIKSATGGIEESRRNALRRMTELQVVRDEVNGRIAYDMLRGFATGTEQEFDETFQAILKAQATGDKEAVKTAFQKARIPFDKTVSGTQQLNNVIDGFFRITAFMNEMRNLREDYPNKPESELEAMAARKVKLTMPTHSQQMDVTKAFNKSPYSMVLVPFMRWKSEVIRIAVNIPMLAMEEINSGNAGQRTRGIKRLAGFIATTSPVAGTVLGGLFSILFGALRDDEDDENRQLTSDELAVLREGLPQWQRSHGIYARLVGGKVQIIDMTNILPFSQFSDIFRLIGEGVTTGKGVNAKAVASYISSEMLGTQIAFTAVNEVANNRDDFGNKIYLDEDTAIQSTLKMLAHLGKGTVTPAIYTKVESLLRAGEQDRAEIALGELTGARPMLHEKTEIVRRGLSRIKEGSDEAVSLRSDISSGRTISKEDIESSINNYQAALNRNQGRLQNFLKFADSIGLAKKDVAVAAKTLGISQQTLSDAAIGRRLAWKPNDAFLRKVEYNVNQVGEDNPAERVKQILEVVRSRPTFMPVED